MALIDGVFPDGSFPTNPFVANPYLATPFPQRPDRPCVAPPFAGEAQDEPQADPLAIRDRLILALSAQLQAERQTRDLLERMVAAGPVDPQVLLAILGDPVPARDDLGASITSPDRSAS